MALSATITQVNTGDNGIVVSFDITGGADGASDSVAVPLTATETDITTAVHNRLAELESSSDLNTLIGTTVS